MGEVEQLTFDLHVKLLAGVGGREFPATRERLCA